jgi:hypothetical protein
MSAAYCWQYMLNQETKTENMKKVIFAIAILFSTYHAIGSPLKEIPVVVLNTSHDIFYFKIRKTMIGGTVEVYNPSGQLVASQNMDNKKLIIDFFDMAPGDYKIVVKKDNVQETFNYIRRGLDLAVTK